MDTLEKSEMLFDCQLYGTGQLIDSNAYVYLNSILVDDLIMHFYWRTWTK